MLCSDSLTPAQRVALSNTICGDLAPVRDLERMGFVKINWIQTASAETIAFFELNDWGEEHLHRHCVLPWVGHHHFAAPTWQFT